jgi:hypothetical protein
MYTLDESLQSLKRILNIVDWSKGYLACACERHVSVLQQIIQTKRLQIDHSFILNLHHLPKEIAVKFEDT